MTRWIVAALLSSPCLLMAAWCTFTRDRREDDGDNWLDHWASEDGTP